MERTVNRRQYYSSEDENIEIFACFPWYSMNEIISSKVIGEINRNREISNSNKNLLGICFITDMDGYFKYIHPNFLNLFEGVENQFYETSILDKDVSLGYPSILNYLVEMIQHNTPNSFLKNRFSKCTDKLHKLEWHMVYNKGLLYFSLAEEPIASIKKDSAINPELSPEQNLAQEINKLYWKIEHAKIFDTNQITIQAQAENQLENKDFEESF